MKEKLYMYEMYSLYPNRVKCEHPGCDKYAKYAGKLYSKDKIFRGCWQHFKLMFPFLR